MVLWLQNLDFDFEKCCSVSLSPVNVYACLVCGKYFQVCSEQSRVTFWRCLPACIAMLFASTAGAHGASKSRQA